MGGGADAMLAAGYSPSGLSPRGRGSPPRTVLATGRSGSIPAWAGEPDPHTEPEHDDEVYPRVGGGASPFTSMGRTFMGLSPRGRGSRIHPAADAVLCGSIPAWAGEPRSLVPPPCCTRVYPRVGGGASIARHTNRSATGLSPRGKRSVLAWSADLQRHRLPGASLDTGSGLRYTG